MKSTVITTERKFRFEMDETEAHVLYAMVNMSDKILEEWITKQDIYTDWATPTEATDIAKELRDTIMEDVQHE